MNMTNLFFAPRLDYFARIDLKQKWNFLKSEPTGSAAINVRFWASLIQNLT